MTESTSIEIHNMINEIRSLHRGESVRGRSFKPFEFVEAATFVERDLGLSRLMEACGDEEKEQTAVELLRYINHTPGVLRTRWYMPEFTSDGYDLLAYGFDELVELAHKLTATEDRLEVWEKLHLRPIYLELGCTTLLERPIYGAELLSWMATPGNPLGDLGDIYDEARRAYAPISLSTWLRRVCLPRAPLEPIEMKPDIAGVYEASNTRDYSSVFEVLFHNALVDPEFSIINRGGELDMVAPSFREEIRMIVADAAYAGVPRVELLRRIAVGRSWDKPLLDSIGEPSIGQSRARQYIAMLCSRVDDTISPQMDLHGRRRTIFNLMVDSYSLERTWGGAGDDFDGRPYKVPEALEALALQLALNFSR